MERKMKAALELLIDEAEQKGLVLLDDVVDYVILNLSGLLAIFFEMVGMEWKGREHELGCLTGRLIKTRIYHILKERNS